MDDEVETARKKYEVAILSELSASLHEVGRA